MTLPTPPIPNLYNTNGQQTERLNPMDDQLFGRSDLSDVIRSVALRYRVQRVIAQNEAQDVHTDVSIMDLRSGNSIVQHNQDDPQFAASINKLPVALLLLEELRSGHATLSQTMTWTAGDVRAGYGVYDQPGAPLQASLGDVLYDMLNHSGNTAVRVIVNGVLGGPQAVNNRLAAKPQIPNTRLQPLDATRFYLGNSTSKESLWIMSQLMAHQDQYVSFMRNALATNIFEDFGVRSQLADNDYVVLVNKIGLLDDPDGNNRHDVGIIYNTKTHKSYAYSFMTTAPYSETDYSATTQANQSLMDMGKPLLRYAGDKPQTAQNQLLQPFAQSAPVPEKKILY